jgi:hypothetical protein
MMRVYVGDDEARAFERALDSPSTPVVVGKDEVKPGRARTRSPIEVGMGKDMYGREARTGKNIMSLRCPCASLPVTDNLMPAVPPLMIIML